MSKLAGPGKKSVELKPAVRPSIRREPVRKIETIDAAPAWWRSDEWEVRLAVIGIILFALALSFLPVGISAITSD